MNFARGRRRGSLLGQKSKSQDRVKGCGPFGGGLQLEGNSHTYTHTHTCTHTHTQNNKAPICANIVLNARVHPALDPSRQPLRADARNLLLQLWHLVSLFDLFTTQCASGASHTQLNMIAC